MSYERPQIATIADLEDDLTRVNTKTRALLLAIRQALLLILGAIEDYLSMARTKENTHKCFK